LSFSLIKIWLSFDAFNFKFSSFTFFSSVFNCPNFLFRLSIVYSYAFSPYFSLCICTFSKSAGL
jgi:hypothetical protein